MTFSIVGRSADGAELGVAVASRFLAVGSAVPAARAGVGALATQALANLTYRQDGLALLQSGAGPARVLERLTEADELREHRQAGAVGPDGSGASWTGSQCQAWAGGAVGDGYALQGNILTGPQVTEAMERAWLDSDPGARLSRRLLAALQAGDRAGGDRRGRQSAALLVVGPDGGYGHGTDVTVDLRVDDHRDPVPELGRLLGLHELYFGRPDPADCLPLDGELAAEVRALLGAAGHPPSDESADAMAVALGTWAGVENLEERLVDGRIDPVVVDHLRQSAPGSRAG
jgi:uncharacterized Ntn-hydrolase superfamily protein